MDHLTIFDELYPKFKITKPIRLIEFFAGYGSQALALKYLGVEFEHWKICEWAVKSIQAYKDIHFENDNTDYSKDLSKEELQEYLFNKGISSNYNEPMTLKQIQRLPEKQLRQIHNNICNTNNLVNIQQVKGKDLEIEDKEDYCYILTYSFPCQDLSLAGKGKGMSDTSTRSGMLWEVERILKELKETDSLPQVLLMENVPMVHSVDNTPDFNKWQIELTKLGYKNYWEDLIATDYGIPQTRNRCFMVSILGDYNYSFPKPIPLKLKLKDLLEENVDEKYFLSDAMLKYMYSESSGGISRKEMFERNFNKKEDVASTITTMAGQRASDNFIKITKDTENYIEWKEKGKLDIDCRASKEDKVSTTICTTPKNKVLIKNATKKGYLEATDGDGVDISSRMEHHRGTVQKGKAQTLTTSGGENNGVVVMGNYTPSKHNASRIVDKDYSAPTVMENHGTITATQTSDLRIRKLTPKECGRLMNVKDEDIDKLNLSDSAMYHIFGDSICSNILMALFGEMLDIDWEKKIKEMLDMLGDDINE